MLMQKLKNEKEIPVGAKLLSAEAVLEGTEVKRMTLKFEGGFVIECSYASYAMSILVPKSKEKKTVFVVGVRDKSSKIGGTFSNEDDAKAFCDRYDIAQSEILAMDVYVEDADNIPLDEYPF